jgi:hypothetical protein
VKQKTKGFIFAASMVLISVVLSVSANYLILLFREQKVVIPHDCPIPVKYQLIVHQINKSLNIPEWIINNWIEQESVGWIAKPGAKGERGLTQVLPENFDTFERLYYTGKENFDPNRDDCSLEIGMKHLFDCYIDSRDWFLALCTYNAGRTRVLTGQIPEGAQLYALKIMGILKKRI